MKKTFFPLFLICFVISGTCFGAIGPNHTAGNAFTTDSNNIKAAVAGNTDFAFALYGRLKDDPNATAPKGNLFFSPYSISTALAIVYGGARGETQKQMAMALRFTLPGQRLRSTFGILQKQLVQRDKSCGYQLLLANALWGQKGEPFLKEFLDLTQSYEAGFNQLDFRNATEQSRQKINLWIEEKTNNKIKDLIPPGGVDEQTAMVLTNAIYFKGDWKTKFSKWKTRKADFAVSAKDNVKVPMMHLKEDFKYYEDEKVQAIELPYKGDEISMLVILPSKTEGIREIENTLTAENLDVLLSKMWMTEVDVYFPKFKMTWGTFSLKNALIKLGMPDAFSPEKADFSGMNGTGNLWVSDVFHQAFIEVNEEGAAAAAATGAIMVRAAHNEFIFRADHPFIFIIKDNRSQSILFLGRVMNPAAG